MALKRVRRRKLLETPCSAAAAYCFEAAEESKRERETAPAEAATWAAKAAKISTGFAPRLLCDMYWLGLLVIGRPWRLRESWLKHSWSLLFRIPTIFSKISDNLAYRIARFYITHGRPADVEPSWFISWTWSETFWNLYIWHFLLIYIKASNWRILKDTRQGPF